MLKYLIIQLCDSSVSFCHYKSLKSKRLITLETLKKGVLWSIKQGVDVQILYPKYQLPYEYANFLSKHPHVKIVSEESDDADVMVLNDLNSLKELPYLLKCPAILHSTYQEFINHNRMLSENLYKFERLNVVFSDVNAFSDSDVPKYEQSLNDVADAILELYRRGHNVQLNILTDRTMLSAMNNCNAGIESVSFAPDGYFYLCPAFYVNRFGNIGNLVDGIVIPNIRLYKLENAPICRICDAFHCKRCVMLNKMLTLEVNTPSRQQCLMAHVERCVSKRLIEKIREYGYFAQDVEIPGIDYMDPIEKIIR